MHAFGYSNIKRKKLIFISEMGAKNRFNVVQNVQFIAVALILSSYMIDVCSGHGRLIEPPSRSSAFRFGFPTPPNYNDHELYCGGFERQHKKNGGRCGECGDAFDLPEPRPNEYGGKYGLGVIVKKYDPATVITVRIELTASHLG